MAPSREVWLASILVVMTQIADAPSQQKRWLSPDRESWETPDELINGLDDFLLGQFVEEYSASFSDAQRKAGLEFRQRMDDFCRRTPKVLDPAHVLVDPFWHEIRRSAGIFIAAFQ